MYYCCLQGQLCDHRLWFWWSGNLIRICRITCESRHIMNNDVKSCSQKFMVNKRLLVSDIFFMFANTRLHVTSQCHDVMSTLIVIQCDSLCANCRFQKTGLVDRIGVQQTPMTSHRNCVCRQYYSMNNPLIVGRSWRSNMRCSRWTRWMNWYRNWRDKLRLELQVSEVTSDSFLAASPELFMWRGFQIWVSPLCSILHSVIDL